MQGNRRPGLVIARCQRDITLCTSCKRAAGHASVARQNSSPKAQRQAKLFASMRPRIFQGELNVALTWEVCSWHAPSFSTRTKTRPFRQPKRGLRLHGLTPRAPRRRCPVLASESSANAYQPPFGARHRIPRFKRLAQSKWVKRGASNVLLAMRPVELLMQSLRTTPGFTRVTSSGLQKRNRR